MENLCEAENGVSGSPLDFGGQDTEDRDVAGSSRSADCETSTWLISFRSTAASETTGETSLGRNEENRILHGEHCRAALVSDDLRTEASKKTREIIRTSGGVGPATFPSRMMKHAVCEIVLEKTTTKGVGAENCSKAREIRQNTATVSAHTCSVKCKSASAEGPSSGPEGQTTWDEDGRETPLTAKDSSSGSSEDYVSSSEDFESTTASSSRRSSDLLQVEGTPKGLEELVVPTEEELAEQHMRFERLQSFCEIIADEDYEFALIDCSVECSSTWNRKTDGESVSQCCASGPANLPKLQKLCSCEGATCPWLSKFPRPPGNRGDFSVAPPDTAAAEAGHAFDVKTAAKNVDRLRESTNKYMEMVGTATKNGRTPAFEDARDAVNVALAAAASAFTGLERLFRPSEGPSCISCGHSMSCSRCYTMVATSKSDPSGMVNNISQQSANAGASSGVVHACEAGDDKRSVFAVVELAAREVNGPLIGGGCKGCASNIYCVTCLEHMQEQTAGLRVVADERNVQGTVGHGSSERGCSIEFATLLTVRKAIPCPRFAVGQEGPQELRRLVVRSQRRPGLSHGIWTDRAFTSEKPATGSGCWPDRCVGIQDTTERYRLRVRDKGTTVIDSPHDEATEISTTSNVRLGTENVRDTSPSDSVGSDQKPSLMSVSRAHLHALRVDLTKDLRGMTCSIPVCGAKNDHSAKGALEKRQYLTPAYPSSQLSKTLVEGRASQPWRPQQRSGVVKASRNDSAGPVIERLNAADVTETEDAPRLVLGTSCTMELRSYAQRRECPSVDYGEALNSKQLCFNVIPKHQKGRTCIRLRSGNGEHSCCAARELQGWGMGGSRIQCCDLNTCVRALERGQDEAYLEARGQSCSGKCNDGKDQNLSVSLTGKRDSVYRGSPTATARFSLVREQRVGSSVVVRQGERARDQTSVSGPGLRGELSAHTLGVPGTNGEGSFQGLRNEDCRHQLHRLAPRRYEVSPSSAAARQQVGADTRVSFVQHRGDVGFCDVRQCHRGTWSLPGCRRRPPCTSSSVSLRYCPGALEAGRISGGLHRDAVAAAFETVGPPAVLRARIGLQRAFTPYSDSRAYQEPYGGPLEAPDTVAPSSPVQQRHRGNMAYVNSVLPSSPERDKKRETEGGTHTVDAGKQAPFCESRTAMEEKSNDFTETKKINSSASCEQQPKPATQNITPLRSPQQEASEVTCGVQWNTRHFPHDRSFPESATVYAGGGAAATVKCSPHLRKGSENPVHTNENPHPTPAFDSVTVASFSENVQKVDSSCGATLRAHLCSGLDTALTEHPAKTVALSPSAALPHLPSAQPGVVTRRWERGPCRCASAASEFGRDCYTCSGVGEPTTVSLMECTSETFLDSARQLDSNSTQHRQHEECHVGVNDTYRSTRTGEAKRRRLDDPLKASPTFAGKQVKRFSCNWSARLSASKFSIGSSISTKSGESTYDCSPGKTAPCHSLDALSDIGVPDGDLKYVEPTTWTWNRLTSREHAESDGQRTPNEPPVAVNLNCKPESDWRPQPVSVPSAALVAAGRCHNRQGSRTHDGELLKGIPGTDGCGGIFSRVDTESIMPLTSHAPCYVCERRPSCSTDVDARPASQAASFLRSYEVSQNNVAEGATRMSGAVPQGGREGSERGMHLGRYASHQDAHEKEAQDQTNEQRINNWYDCQEETVLHERQRTGGVVCRRPLFATLPGAVLAGGSHTDAVTAGTEFSPAMPPSLGMRCAAPRSCSGASASAVEALEESKRKQLTFPAPPKQHATEAGEHQEKHRRTENQRKCSTRDSSEATTSVPPRTPYPRYEIKNGVAPKGSNSLKLDIKQTGNEKKIVTDNADDEHSKGEQSEVQHCEECLMELETKISSAVGDLLQSRRRAGRTRQPAATRAKDAKASCHGQTPKFGTTTSLDRSPKGCKPSRAPGRKNRSPRGNNIVEEGDSLSGISLPSTTAPQIATDSAACARVCSAALLTESDTTAAEACRRTCPKEDLQTKAGEGTRNGVVCGHTDDSLFTAEMTRRSWRTGADGKVLYDARGRKISGVWYDTGRRLWRIVFTQGERRRTKGFSLKQYGFEQARNLAIQCKLAIEAGKAPCEKEFS